LGNGLLLVLTPGHRAGCTQLPGLVAGLRYAPGAVVADKASDTNAVLVAMASRHAEPVIAPKFCCPYDQNLYADRNKVERFFGRLKEASGFATRRDQNGRVLLGHGPPARSSRLATITVHTP
jgi:transposase